MTATRIGSVDQSLIKDVDTVIRSFAFNERWTKPDKFGLEGIIDNHPVSVEVPGIKEVKRVLSEAYFKPRKCRGYESVSVTRVQGSARFHDDQGYGCVASCLIYHSSSVVHTFDAYRHPKGAPHIYEDSRPQLVTLKDFLDIDLGDIFVFNANRYHAWINNGISILAQLTVKKQNHSNS
jgi:hypothetical protein